MLVVPQMHTFGDQHQMYFVVRPEWHLALSRQTTDDCASRCYSSTWPNGTDAHNLIGRSVFPKQSLNSSGCCCCHFQKSIFKIPPFSLPHSGSVFKNVIGALLWGQPIIHSLNGKELQIVLIPSSFLVDSWEFVYFSWSKYSQCICISIIVQCHLLMLAMVYQPNYSRVYTCNILHII